MQLQESCLPVQPLGTQTAGYRTTKGDEGQDGCLITDARSLAASGNIMSFAAAFFDGAV